MASRVTHEVNTLALGACATTATGEDRACRFIAETGGEQGGQGPERPSSDRLVRVHVQTVVTLADRTGAGIVHRPAEGRFGKSLRFWGSRSHV
jgi:hypothetical protein